MDDRDEGSVWTQYCRRHAMQAGCALCDAAKENIWPSRPWQFAVLTWSEEQNIARLGRRAWQYFAPLLLNEMPDKTLLEVAPNASSWLLSMAEFIDNPDELFLPLCQRILDLPFVSKPASTSGDPVQEAINHPVGGVTLALGKFWYKIADPNQHDSLPDNVEALFRQICNVDKKQFRHGRVVLAMYLPALCKVARAWTKENLLPYFHWHNPEARAMWAGFLSSPHYHPSLMADLKADFLETAAHYDELGDYLGSRFVHFLTDVALARIDGYSSGDFRKTFAQLPQGGLNVAADKMWRFCEAAGDRREEFWKNRIQPFWKEVRPKSKNWLSPEISQSLAELCLAAGDEFPAALKMLGNWLKPHPSYYSLVSRFYHKTLETISRADSKEHLDKMEAGPQAALLKNFPEESLQFLVAIIPTDPSSWWGGREELQQCLKDIAEAKPELRDDRHWQELNENCRRATR
ncbi:MAG TPA: hypothetical protein DEB25_06790 [Desulfobulbaceae bacterium]|nr:hypothetical protein [Desulfobulbaceae bacterium]